MRIRQMGFSSKIKAHKGLLTLEMLRFIIEFLEDGKAQQAALRAGIPETYASRYGNWLKKRPLVVAALETEIDEQDQRRLRKALIEIEKQMQECKMILGIEDV